MINMCMREKDEIDGTGAHGQRGILKIIPALLHPVINEDPFPCRLQKMSASGHLMIRSDKCQLHIPPPDNIVLYHAESAYQKTGTRGGFF